MRSLSSLQIQETQVNSANLKHCIGFLEQFLVKSLDVNFVVWVPPDRWGQEEMIDIRAFEGR